MGDLVKLSAELYNVLSPKSIDFYGVFDYDTCRKLAKVYDGTIINEKPQLIIFSDIVSYVFDDRTPGFRRAVEASTTKRSELHKEYRSHKELNDIDKDFIDSKFDGLSTHLREVFLGRLEARRSIEDNEELKNKRSEKKRRDPYKNDLSAEISQKQQLSKQRNKELRLNGSKLPSTSFGEMTPEDRSRVITWICSMDYMDLIIGNHLSKEDLGSYYVLRYISDKGIDLDTSEEWNSIINNTPYNIFMNLSNILFNRVDEIGWELYECNGDYSKLRRSDIQVIVNEFENKYKFIYNMIEAGVRVDGYDTDIITNRKSNKSEAFYDQFVDRYESELGYLKVYEGLIPNTDKEAFESKNQLSRIEMTSSETLLVAVACSRQAYNGSLKYIISTLKRFVNKCGAKMDIAKNVLEADVLLYIPDYDKNDLDLINFTKDLNEPSYYDNPVWNEDDFPAGNPGIFKLNGFHPVGERVAILTVDGLRKRLGGLYRTENRHRVQKESKPLENKVIQKSDDNMVESHPNKITPADKTYWTRALFQGEFEDYDYETAKFSHEHEDEYVALINKALLQCDLRFKNENVIPLYEAEYSEKPGWIKICRGNNGPIGPDSELFKTALCELYYHNNKVKIVDNIEQADVLFISPTSRITPPSLIETAIQMNKNIKNAWDEMPVHQSSPLKYGMIHPIGEKIFVCTPQSFINRIRMLYGGKIYAKDVTIKSEKLRAYSWYEAILNPKTSKPEETYETPKQELSPKYKMGDKIKLKVIHPAGWSGAKRDKNVLVQEVEGLSEYEVGAIKDRLPANVADKYWDTEKLKQFYKLYLYSVAGTKEYADVMQYVCNLDVEDFENNIEELRQSCTGKKYSSSTDDWLDVSLTHEDVLLYPKSIRVFFADQLYRKLIDGKSSPLASRLSEELDKRFGMHSTTVSDLRIIDNVDAVIINKQSPVNDLYIVKMMLDSNLGEVYRNESLRFYPCDHGDGRAIHISATGESIMITTVEGLINRIAILKGQKPIYSKPQFGLSDKNKQVIQTYQTKYFSKFGNISPEERAIKILNMMKYYGE